MLLRNRREIGAQAVIEIVLEFFCRIEVNFRPSQKIKLAWENFWQLKLDSEFFVQEEQREESIWTENRFFEEATGEEKVGLRIFYPSRERGEKRSLDLEKFCPRE